MKTAFTFYGAVFDFTAGNPPIAAQAVYSKANATEDGKAFDIFAESHPMPVIVSNLGVVKAKVCD